MGNKELFIQKLSFILKEKKNRIKIVMMGQELIQIFERSQKQSKNILTETLLIDSLTKHVRDYANNPAQQKELANDLINMSELIVD